MYQTPSSEWRSRLTSRQGLPASKRRERARARGRERERDKERERACARERDREHDRPSEADAILRYWLLGRAEKRENLD